MAVQNARRTRVVIDTSVLIDLIKSGKLIQFAEKYDGCITSVTLYEYLRGELYLGRNISEIKNFLEKIFDILYMDNDAIRKACELWLSLAKKRKAHFRTRYLDKCNLHYKKSSLSNHKHSTL
ncbi:MAG: hypothetical protein J7J30_00945 [Candidatus Odinarchaeota archaeon]|nr:hypothetical protein [Candidatus Odinarchaeota archaeon]